MKTKTFWDWLMMQRKRNDPVGDVANDAWRERAHISGLTATAFVRHVRYSLYACDEAVDAARWAKAEYAVHVFKTAPDRTPIYKEHR